MHEQMQLHEYSEYRLARDVQFELHLQAKPGRCKDDVLGTHVSLTSHADCIGLCIQPNIILLFLFLHPLNKQLYQTLSSLKYGSNHHPSSPYLSAASARTFGRPPAPCLLPPWSPLWLPATSLMTSPPATHPPIGLRCRNRGGE